MPGLKAIADRLDGQGAVARRHLARRRGRHRRGGVLRRGRAGSTPWPALPRPSCSAAGGAGGRRDRRRGDAGGAAAPAADAPPPGALLDFRPVFRNRAAMAWIVGYTVHTWELAALRAWARHLPRRHHRPAWRAGLAARPDGDVHRRRAGRHRGVDHRQRDGAALRPGAGGGGGDGRGGGAVAAATGLDRAWSPRRSPRSASSPGTPRSTSTARR